MLTDIRGFLYVFGFQLENGPTREYVGSWQQAEGDERILYYVHVSDVADSAVRERAVADHGIIVVIGRPPRG